MEHHYYKLTPDPQGVSNKHYKDYSLQKHRNQYSFPRSLFIRYSKYLPLKILIRAKENVPRGTFLINFDIPYLQKAIKLIFRKILNFNLASTSIAFNFYLRLK